MPAEATVCVIGAHECPLYKVGDELTLSGTGIRPSGNKATCIILAGDIMEVLIKYGDTDNRRKYVFDCSECTGLIRLEYLPGPPREKIPPSGEHQQDITPLINILTKFPFFQALEESNIRELVSFLKLKGYDAGECIIKKGDTGRNLFIIVSGKVEVLGDEDISIAYLGKGEIFGEMSLLSGDNVGATIRVVAPARVLYLNGDDFRRVLQKYPQLQMYLACLLARRLARTNLLMLEEFSSGMVGKLTEMPPSGLFQMFNLNQKTGVLSFELSAGPGTVVFNNGEIVGARYDDLEGSRAFYEILKEKQGRFKFSPGLPEPERHRAPLGDFMKLLMEGARHMDEEASPMSDGS